MDKDKELQKNITYYKDTFNSDSGQKVLWDILKASGFLTDGFNVDPYKSAYAAGTRAMAVRILHLLELTELDVKTMAAENRKAEQYERLHFDV